jgi:hypothetical protein
MMRAADRCRWVHVLPREKSPKQADISQPQVLFALAKPRLLGDAYQWIDALPLAAS